MQAQLADTHAPAPAHLLDLLLKRLLYPLEKVTLHSVERLPLAHLLGEEADRAQTGDGVNEYFFEAVARGAESFHELLAVAAGADDACVDGVGLQVGIVLEDEVAVVHHQGPHLLLLGHRLKGPLDAMRPHLLHHPRQQHLADSPLHSLRRLEIYRQLLLGRDRADAQGQNLEKTILVLPPEHLPEAVANNLHAVPFRGDQLCTFYASVHKGDLGRGAAVAN